ncbi:MAG: ribosome small subunit-dependent GTPase A [Bacteroidales bacterium]|jgi:ribosome biogenesis GTPase|nr:ribosome small subunit-dependent GTPase A [Bacteroidales bacterium]
MTGLVIKSTGSWYRVIDSNNGTIYDCRIKGKLRLRNSRSTSPVTIGDTVDFEIEQDSLGIITNIHERKNYIIRKSVNLSKESHIIAANIDRAYLVVTISQPKTLLSFVDRFLVSTEAYAIPVTLVFNKYDVYSEKDLKQLSEWEDIYAKAGYSTLRLSCKTRLNCDKLLSHMQNKISVVVGNSGVGKTTILNTLFPELSLKTQKISQSHKTGQHTTTFSEMFLLPENTYIIDTPGIKSFGLLELEKHELHHYFPEIFVASHNCKFHNCSHSHEPGCAVLPAVAENRIAKSRYINYCQLYDEEKSKHR